MYRDAKDRTVLCQLGIVSSAHLEAECHHRDLLPCPHAGISVGCYSQKLTVSLCLPTPKK